MGVKLKIEDKHRVIMGLVTKIDLLNVQSWDFNMHVKKIQTQIP